MGCGGSKDMVREPQGNRQQQEQDDATGGLSEAYEVKHLLGSGSAGDTWLCRDRSTGELVAVKLMKRPIPPLMGNNIMREIKIGAQLGKGHLNIVKPREVVLTRTHMGLVMEYVAGGNMADYILKTILLKFGSFDTRDGLVMEEDEARYFFQQIISAVDYCHKNQVAHRDLKMDNTLLDDNDPPRIKLCDFGFAKWWTDMPEMSTITGTPDYMSPQLLGAKANKQKVLYDGTKADVWACGVLLCVMLIGRFPFEGVEMSNATNLEEVSAHVWHQQQSQRWCDNPVIAQDCEMLSPECMDLLSRMFELDETQRITVPEIRAHTWLNKPLPPLYAAAMEQYEREQAAIDKQVKEGVFVSKDRDAALRQMIYLAASRYDPSTELLEHRAPSASEARTGSTSRGGSAVDLRSPLTSLRKISLTAIKPYEYAPVTHVDLATISNFFKAAVPEEANEGSTHNGSTCNGSTHNGSTHNGSEAAAALAAAAGAAGASSSNGAHQQHPPHGASRAGASHGHSSDEHRASTSGRQPLAADGAAAPAAGARHGNGTAAANGPSLAGSTQVAAPAAAPAPAGAGPPGGLVPHASDMVTGHSKGALQHQQLHQQQPLRRAEEVQPVA